MDQPDLDVRTDRPAQFNSKWLITFWSHCKSLDFIDHKAVARWDIHIFVVVVVVT